MATELEECEELTTLVLIADIMALPGCSNVFVIYSLNKVRSGRITEILFESAVNVTNLRVDDLIMQANVGNTLGI